jgi:Golgi phosphoprotein 3 GPP34
MTPTAAPDDLLLAEELLLLALHDEKGHDTTRGADGALAGALLLDLAAGGWLELADGRLVPAAPPPAGPPPAGVLADALAAVEAERRPRKAEHWVRKLPGKLRPIKARVAARLVERGVLSEERRKVLGLVPRDVYPTTDPEPERTLREQLRAELTGAAEVSSRTALLVPLLRAHGLVDTLVAKGERREARRRAKAIAQDPARVGAAVPSVLNDTQVAVQAAIMASIVASGGDGGGGDGGGGGGDGGGGGG